MSGFTSSTGAEIITDQIREWINNGQGYTLSLGNFSSGAGTNNYAASIFNPSSSKNILIYSAKAANGSGGLTAYLYLITSDTAFTQTNPINSKAGGPASSIQSTCRIATSNQSLSGTLREMQTIVSATQELLTNGDCILLPAGANNGVALYIQTYAAGLNNAILKWVEF